MHYFWSVLYIYWGLRPVKFFFHQSCSPFRAEHRYVCGLVKWLLLYNPIIIIHISIKMKGLPNNGKYKFCLKKAQASQTSTRSQCTPPSQATLWCFHHLKMQWAMDRSITEEIDALIIPTMSVPVVFCHTFGVMGPSVKSFHDACLLPFRKPVYSLGTLTR